MKKLLLAILIPTSVLVVAAGTLFFLVNDTSTPSYQLTNDTSETIISRNLYNAFKNTKTDAAVTYSMGQDDFNQIIGLAYKSASSQVKEYVRGAEIKIDGDKYIIKVYAKAWILQSNVQITCRFSQDDDNYYLKIEDAKLGHIPGLQGIALSILKSSVGDSSLDSAIKSTGVRLKSDLANERFIYNKKDAKTDMCKLLQEDGKDTFASGFVSNAFDMNLLSLNFTDKLEAKLDLKPLATNDRFCTPESKIDEEALNLEANKVKLNKLMNQKVVDNQNDHPKMVFNYLLRGYDSIDEEDKNYIDSLDMTSIGLNDAEKRLYKGYEPEAPRIQETVLQAATNSTLLSSEGLLISENSINQYLQYQDLLGYSFLLTHTEDQQNYDFTYITIDNFYVNLGVFDGKEQMNIVLGLSINGYETSMILENTRSENIPYGIKLKNENIYFGSSKINDDLKSVLYEQVHDTLEGGSFFNFEDGYFIVNFEGYLGSYIETLNNIPGNPMTLALETTVQGTSLTDENAGIRIRGTTQPK